MSVLGLFTFVHVALSLVGIAAGFVIADGLLRLQRREGWTRVFLATTVLTSATGFGFPVHELKPSHIVGIISLVLLALAILARYAAHLFGPWRRVYVIGALLALYFNVFVLIVQLFEKVPPLKALAPKGTEPPFAITQGIVLIAFAVLIVVTTIRFDDRLVAPV